MRPIFSKAFLIMALTFYFFSTPAWAEPTITHLKGSATQGGLMVFQTESGNQVRLDNQPLQVSPDGLFLVGFHRNDTAIQQLEAENAAGEVKAISLQPQPRQWDIQRIDNLPTNMVTPKAEIMARIKKDIADVKQARASMTLFDDALHNGFDWPVWGRISGIYGSQRILNGQPRQPHYGIDIAVPSGVGVRAAASGKVTMAADLYFTGGTIIIDHGYGLNSTYSHLQKMHVSKGDIISRGQLIATVGSTGRSTGPHLDWRINWQKKRLDPMLITGPLLPEPPISKKMALFAVKTEEKD
jgi:murein DD-endopeptidase MepM/ murein hydrolase activator NlpD